MWATAVDEWNKRTIRVLRFGQKCLIRRLTQFCICWFLHVLFVLVQMSFDVRRVGHVRSTPVTEACVFAPSVDLGRSWWCTSCYNHSSSRPSASAVRNTKAQSHICIVDTAKTNSHLLFLSRHRRVAITPFHAIAFVRLFRQVSIKSYRKLNCNCCDVTSAGEGFLYKIRQHRM
jgi:hypothetical protein